MPFESFARTRNWYRVPAFKFFFLQAHEVPNFAHESHVNEPASLYSNSYEALFPGTGFHTSVTLSAVDCPCISLRPVTLANDFAEGAGAEDDEEDDE